MSNTTINDVLLNGDNEFSNEYENGSSGEHSLNVSSWSSKIILSLSKSRQNVKKQDMNPDYAIGLLKREDENVNV